MQDPSLSPGGTGVTRPGVPQFNEGSDLRSDQIGTAAYSDRRYELTSRSGSTDQIAKALGWFSIGLG
ncbi:hypothetical protein E4K72_13380, partial [Oxalobacteraceae bacterium OM1]